MRERVGPYRIVGRLGEGGMGVVYEAYDERLGRTIALKMIRDFDGDPHGRERLRREARTAAGISHPNVCQIFDVGEDDGDVYVAMEKIEGRPLSAVIAGGPSPLADAVKILDGVLAALSALHARGIVHRDLKPSNVFVTADGVKLLDFGLARAVAGSPDMTLTRTGVVVGTPRYMAPEQWGGTAVDARSDLFAAGALAFELLSGRPAFDGESPLEIARAIAHGSPPALVGSPGVEAVDRVVHRALAKSPADRWPSADAMRAALTEATRAGTLTDVSQVRAVTRLIVPAFRLLRPDPEIEFLCFSLPDAIASSLSGIGSLVVRSRAAGGSTADAGDLRALAAEADVDAVLIGTLLRAGTQVRVSTQLAEAPSGTLLATHTAQAPMDDLFALQDDLARRIVESLAVPLSAREARVQRDVPSSASAYEMYLRANRLALDSGRWAEAAEMYRACLREDSSFAPAWARLGRVYRLLSKYGEGAPEERVRLADEAFREALSRNPDLSLAHNLYSYLEVESGRVREALIRLLGRVASGAGDADTYAGLVMVCRYAGLLDASLEADRRAKRLDPHVQTSVCYTHWMRGEYERAIATESSDVPYMKVYALTSLGRLQEAGALSRELGRRDLPPTIRNIITAQQAAIDGDAAGVREGNDRIRAAGFRDPEGFLFMARNEFHVGERERGLVLLRDTLAGGLYAVEALERDPWFTPMSDDPDFSAIREKTRSLAAAAAAAFVAHDGPRLLGEA